MKADESAHRQIQCKRSQSQADGEGEHNRHEQEGCQKVSLQRARPCVSKAHVFFHTTEAMYQHNCTYCTLPAAHAMLCLSCLGGGHRSSAVPEPCCAGISARRESSSPWQLLWAWQLWRSARRTGPPASRQSGGLRHMSWHGAQIQPGVTCKLQELRCEHAGRA